MEILHQFGVEPMLLLGQIVNFLLLLFILKKVFYKPLLTHLDKRALLIQKGVENAQKADQILQKANEKYEKRILEAKSEFDIILSDAKREASAITKTAQDEARKNVDAMLLEAKERIEQERIALRVELRSEMTGLVMTAVEKVTRGLLTKSQTEKFTKDSIKDITS
jgi:F-type H+-transporting ATPase subunit b